MAKLPALFRTIRFQLLYVLGIPAFFLGFVLLYKPAPVVRLIATAPDRLSFNTTIIMCILLGVLFLSRTLLLTLYRHLDMTWLKLLAWETAELVGMSLFTALYVALSYHGGIGYFSAVGYCAFSLFLVTMYPYIVFNLAGAYAGRAQDAAPADDSLMRFRDSTQKVRLLIASSAVLYVLARENYVYVYYLEGERVKEFHLRNSLRALEPLLQKYGLQRCQRSYFINPRHIKVLRREKDGSIVAELNVPDLQSIPVSPKYQDALSQWL